VSGSLQWGSPDRAEDVPGDDGQTRGIHDGKTRPAFIYFSVSMCRRQNPAAVGMIGDVHRSVTELTQRLQRARAGLTAATAQAVGDGTDRTGSITIVLGDDGIARDVHVAADWRRRLNPAGVGPAVVAADAEAARRHAAATAEADALVGEADNPGRSPVDGRAGQSFVDRRGTPTVPGPSALSWLIPVAPTAAEGRRRSVAELTAAVLAAADDFDHLTAPPAPVVGVGAGGAVQVTVARGRITECTVNPAWLSHQDEVTLAHALREAIGAAAADALDAHRPYIDYRQRLEALVADARATLQDMSRGINP